MIKALPDTKIETLLSKAQTGRFKPPAIGSFGKLFPSD